MSALAAHAQSSNPIIQKTIEAIDADGLKGLKTDLDEQCLSVVNAPRISNLPQVLTLSACREFARYFGAIDQLTDAQKETLKWLAVQPRMMPTLMSAVSGKDPPARVLGVLDLLRARQPARVDSYPDLATALAVVWDKSFVVDADRHAVSFDRDHVANLLDYFTNPRSNMRFNLKVLPWQLDVYVVDMKISDNEIQWAASRYSNNYSIPDLYFEVNYDDRAFFNGDDKKISTHPYTLQNILQYGGVCVEQAYFAEQIAKALGIPSCMCTSRGGGAGDVGHAWLGVLTQLNGKAVWDFDKGRYTEDLFWSADIIDPQTHAKLTDADVGLIAGLQNVSPATRMTSALEMKLADLLPPARRVDLYMREIAACPGNRAAWVALADLGAKHNLTPSQTEAFSRTVDTILIQAYPDFAWQVLVRLASGLPASDRINQLDDVARRFSRRPDLRARIRLIQADLLLAGDQNDLAMRALADVLTNDLNAGPIILQAMLRVDKLMRAQNNLLRLANIYAEVWPKIPAPGRSAYVYWTPYYLIGKTYLTLLDSMGRPGDAELVRQKLVNIIPEGAQLR